MKIRVSSILIAILAMSFSLFAQDYVVVMKETKLFDEPNASGYVTKNQSDEDVTVKRGMAFKVVDTRPGWSMVEYSSGLRALLLQTMAFPKDDLEVPEPGDFQLMNNDEKIVNISSAGGNWTLTYEGKNFIGKLFGKTVIFFDKNGMQCFSLVRAGGKPLVYSYDNSLTRFF